MGIAAGQGLGYALLALSAASAGTQAYQAHRASQEQKAQAREAKETAIKQKQVAAEQAPEQAIEAGTNDAVKKSKTSYGIEESIINNNLASANTIGQKETWG